MKKIIILLSVLLAIVILQTTPVFAQTQPVVAGKQELSADNTMSPFGVGSCAANNSSAKANATWVPQLAAIGIKMYRTPNTGWGAVEKVEGKWTWDELDKQMKYLEDQHMAFGAILHGAGRKDPRGNLPVNGLSDWSNYVSEVAKHVKGRIKYFEVWNEPPNGTGRTQTPADYAKIVAGAYDAVHAVDQTDMLGITAKSAHINYIEQTIKNGAKDHFDWISLHPYEVLNGIADNIGSEAVYMSMIPSLRKMLAVSNPAKINVPVIFTELGTDARKGADNQGQTLVKAYTMGIAQGVSCIEWFEARDGDSGPMGLIDRDGNPRPSYKALAQMVKHFGQHPGYLGWVLFNGKDYGFVFQGEKGTVLSTWAPKGAPDHVNFGQAVQIVDPLTGNATNANAYDLTVAPIFVIGVPEKLVAKAKANKNKPFPWGGDYTKAKSVSVTFGRKTVEKGLHTHSGSDVAAAVVLYGGGARSGEVPGGNVFMVDPNFMSYTTEPIEISVVIRRNQANDPAKITLEYECNNDNTPLAAYAYKKTAPYDVPDNKKWYTAKWRIDDAQFVSMYGFNFRYNAGKYYIKKVTVKKLK